MESPTSGGVDPSAASSSRAEAAALHPYHVFAFLNALAFLLTAGPVATLYAKSLGANGVVLGALAALIPLSTMLQLPGARLIRRLGYKRLIFSGFLARAGVSLAIAGLPWLTLALGWPAQVPLVLFCAALVPWHTVRCLANVAYFPWMADLVSEWQRGRFLAHNNMGMHLGELASTLLAWGLLTGGLLAVPFGWIFLLSALFGGASVMVVRRVPGGGSPSDDAPERLSGEPVGLGEMLASGPFRRLLFFNGIQAILFAGWTAFAIAFMKDRLRLGDGEVVALHLFLPAGALIALFVTARFLDLTSGRSIVQLALGAFVFVFGGWALTAAGVVPWSAAGGAALWLAAGVAWGVFNTSNTRVFIGAVPPRGRDHYLAVLMVATSAVAGLAPVASGLMLDVLDSFEPRFGLFRCNNYALYFGALAVLAAMAVAAARFLPEKGQPLHTLDRRAFALGSGLRRIFRR